MVTKTKDEWAEATADMEEIELDYAPPLMLRDEGAIFQGQVLDRRQVRKGKKKSKERVLVCANTETGETVSVWQSAGLKALVEKARKDDFIAIQYVGMSTTKRGREMRQYKCAIRRM